MTNTIDQCRYFDRKGEGDLSFIEHNPYDIKTDREIFSLNKNLPIYRAMYVRNDFIYVN